MGKLVLLKNLDENALRAALNIEDSAIMLLQDAVHLVRERPRFRGLFEKHMVYILGKDAAKRGLPFEAIDGLLILGYDGFVELLFSGLEVINL